MSIHENWCYLYILGIDHLGIPTFLSMHYLFFVWKKSAPHFNFISNLHRLRLFGWESVHIATQQFLEKFVHGRKLSNDLVYDLLAIAWLIGARTWFQFGYRFIQHELTDILTVLQKCVQLGLLITKICHTSLFYQHHGPNNII
jgi:hypothetical protein